MSQVSPPYDSTDMSMDCRSCTLVGEDEALEDHTLAFCSRKKATVAVLIHLKATTVGSSFRVLLLAVTAASESLDAELFLLAGRGVCHFYPHTSSHSTTVICRRLCTA